jgi:hypothetical protein
MSRQFPNDRTPRNLVEVPTPINQNIGPFDQQQQQQQQQSPFNNNNAFSNNNINAQSNDFGNNQFAITPRLGPKKKTIIIKDEKGNEISRITSSTNARLPESFLPRSGVVTPINQFQLGPINPYPPVQNTLNPLVLQPQYLVQNQVPPPPPPSAMVTPVPMFMAQPFSANPYMDKGPLITQTIPEETIIPNSGKSRSSAHYKTLEK